MTRHLGLMGAQPYLVEGKTFNPREALELGLVHELVADAGELRAKALAWMAANPQAQHPWEAKDYKIPGGTPANPKIAAALSVAPAMLKKQTRGLYPCARSHPGLHGRRHAGGPGNRLAHRKPLPRQAHDRSPMPRP
jgi:3-hydroxyacyl-CoA dehydrogenase/enoyl-CoA hydratase/3-hydroxybutyryl-CoA epimerase